MANTLILELSSIVIDQGLLEAPLQEGSSMKLFGARKAT